MIPIATTSQMRECDRKTIEEIGLPGMVLMENAARGVAARASELLDNDVEGKLIGIYCGSGNNGGDGLAAARYLKGWGAEIELWLLADSKKLKGDAAKQFELYRKVGGEIHQVSNSRDLKPIAADLVIDALLGTGFTGNADGLYRKAIEVINQHQCPILAVDIPSGVKGDSGEIGAVAVKADTTVTFGLVKPGLLLPPGSDYSGEVELCDIGIPPNVVADCGIDIFLIEEDDVRAALPHRLASSHKGDTGHVYILAGSPGLTGAAALVAEAAMRTGSGLVVVGIPASLNSILEIKLTEAMSQPLPENSQGFLAPKALEAIKSRLEWADAVVFGPGIGQDPDTLRLFRMLLPHISTPLVIDADGLNLLSRDRKLLLKLPAQTILTPHPGEFGRLTGKTIAEIAANRVALVREYARKWRVILHLKGAPSITGFPEGVVIINSTGNAGMATGGSGDVLTGIIASLLGQGMAYEQAAAVGAYLHGAAGDRAAESLGQAGMVAGDIVTRLPETIKALTE